MYESLTAVRGPGQLLCEKFLGVVYKLQQIGTMCHNFVFQKLIDFEQ